jgi:hypothetical protein
VWWVRGGGAPPPPPNCLEYKELYNIIRKLRENFRIFNINKYIYHVCQNSMAGMNCKEKKSGF